MNVTGCFAVGEPLAVEERIVIFRSPFSTRQNLLFGPTGTHGSFSAGSPDRFTVTSQLPWEPVILFVIGAS